MTESENDLVVAVLASCLLTLAAQMPNAQASTYYFDHAYGTAWDTSTTGLVDFRQRPVQYGVG